MSAPGKSQTFFLVSWKHLNYLFLCFFFFFQNKYFERIISVVATLFPGPFPKPGKRPWNEVKFKREIMTDGV